MGKGANLQIENSKNLNFLKANRKDFDSGRKLSSMKKSTNDENISYRGEMIPEEKKSRRKKETCPRKKISLRKLTCHQKEICDWKEKGTDRKQASGRKQATGRKQAIGKNNPTKVNMPRKRLSE